MLERREYEKADARGRKSLRAIKLPGEARHTDRAESATAIARRLAAQKRAKRLQEDVRG